MLDLWEIIYIYIYIVPQAGILLTKAYLSRHTRDLYQRTMFTGAVAGLADQPIQTLIQDTPSARGAGRAATGLVSGLGKGLVGVVTKPLGGAAELVSQTGYGLLHGTGLAHLPQARCQAIQLATADLPNSFLKYLG